MNEPNSFTPHPVLTPHYQSLDDKQGFLRKVFDNSAVHYETIATWGFFGTGDWYRRQALQRAGLKPGMKLLDVAAGTGITARAGAWVLGSAQDVTCAEPSEGMLKECQRLIPQATHILAPAESMPFPDNSFDFLTMGFALRHVENLAVAFQEYRRVLKPGGKVLILDITKPENRIANTISMFYFRHVMPRLTRLLTGSPDAEYLMDYYWKTLDQMVQPAIVLSALKTAGFQETNQHVVIGMFSEYSAVKP